MPPAEEEKAAPADKAVGAQVPPALPRKIIYNAQVDLIVESIPGTAEALARLVKENGGYISESDIQSYAQQRQQATWKVRVPVDRFDAFRGDPAGRVAEEASRLAGRDPGIL